jgi:hypothetical protein
MAKTISRLVLVRVTKPGHEGILGEFETLAIKKLTNVSPKAWPDEAGVSHHGFVISGLRLSSLQQLTALAADSDGVVTVHDLRGTQDEDVVSALAAIGLRINELAD